MNIEEALSMARAVPDFPREGILFHDITPLLSNPDAFLSIIAALSELDNQADVVAGIEARGFIVGSSLATYRKNGFVPIRKRGKLPHQTFSRSYELEYGVAEIEIHRDAFNVNSKVLLIDDVLATGGTLEAAIELISETSARISSVAVLIEICHLGGRARIEEKFPDLTIHSLVQI